MRRVGYPEDFYRCKVFDHSNTNILCYPRTFVTFPGVFGDDSSCDQMEQGSAEFEVTGGSFTPIGLRFGYCFYRNAFFDRDLFAPTTQHQTYRVLVFYVPENAGVSALPFTEVVGRIDGVPTVWSNESIFDDVGGHFFGPDRWVMLYDKVIPLVDILGTTVTRVESAAYETAVPETTGIIEQPVTSPPFITDALGEPFGAGWNWSTTNVSADVPPVVGIISIPGAGTACHFPGQLQRISEGGFRFEVTNDPYEVEVPVVASTGHALDECVVKNMPQLYDEVLIDLRDYGLDIPVLAEKAGRFRYMVICDSIIDQPNSSYLRFNFNSRFFFVDSTRRVKK